MPAFSNLAEPLFAAGARLTRHQTEPRRHLPAILEVSCVCDRGDDRARCDGADAGNSLQTLRIVTVLCVFLDLPVTRIDLLLERCDLLAQLAQQNPHACR